MRDAMRWAVILGVLVMVCQGACSSADTPADAQHTDVADLGTPDGGGQDLGAPDLGTQDLAAPDLGTPDLAAPDLAVPDQGTPDLGTPDLVAPDQAPDTSPSACTSGEWWNPGWAEGPGMHPGRTCIQCHVDSNAETGESDAPIFAFAGTLFPSSHEADDCLSTGATGAEVQVRFADGTTISATVDNDSGNFHADPGGPYQMPFTAKVLFAGRTREMGGAQTTADCNACHSMTGSQGAPGRILLP